MSYKISHLLMTPEAYLAHEQASLNTRHEYIDGYVLAMAGGTIVSGNFPTPVLQTSF